MTSGAAFAAGISAVLAAAGDPRAGDPPARPEAAEVVGEATPEADAAEPADEAVLGGDDAGPETEVPAPAGGQEEPLVGAPPGAALADSAPLLIARTERADGWAVERLLEPSGDVVEHVVNRAGTVQVCRKVGSIFTLRVVGQHSAAGGEVVQVVRDGSGALLRFAVGRDGEPRAVALIAPPAR